MVGHLVHAIVRHVANRDAPLGGPAKIHRVVPHPTADNHPAFLQPVDDPGGEAHLVKNDDRVCILDATLEFTDGSGLQALDLGQAGKNRLLRLNRRGDIVSDDNLEHRRKATAQTALGQAHANLPWPSRLANIAPVNHPARLHNAAMLLFACTTTTALGQAETTAETLVKAHKAHAKAELDYTSAMKRDPDNASLYHQRGVVRFFQLKFDESLADFDKFIELMPSREPYHWQRGLVHYYAGKYKAGRKQFESHQTVNTQDVENAVWHYLCISKTDGAKEAEKHFIKITSDRRVPLKEIHALFAGKGTERQVLDSIKASDPGPAALARNRFYGHLYLGLYYEAQGNANKATNYIAKAAKGYEAHGYMGQVARVHHEWLAKKEKQAKRKAD